MSLKGHITEKHTYTHSLSQQLDDISMLCLFIFGDVDLFFADKMKQQNEFRFQFKHFFPCMLKPIFEDDIPAIIILISAYWNYDFFILTVNTEYTFYQISKELRKK